MPDQLPLPQILRPNERGVTEGNLAELPLWALSNKDARPVRENGLVAKEDYDRRIVLGEEALPDGGRKVVSLSISASPKYGFPTMFAFRVLVALMEAARAANFASPVIFINRHQLARRLGLRKPAAHQYEDLSNAMLALETVRLEYHHTWYDKRQGKRVPHETSEGFVYSHHWVDERRLGTKDGDEANRSYVRLGDKLFESLKATNYVGVDLDYLNVLDRPLAERLYVYLTKKDANPTARYAENLKALARKNGLKAEKASVIKRSLWPALERLCAELEVPDQPGKRVRFLERFWLSEDEQVLHVEFHRPNSPGARLRRVLQAKPG